LHDFERNMGGFGEMMAAERGGNGLVVTTAGTKEISEFAVFPAKALGSVMALEAAHTSDPAFDAAMVLLKAVILSIGAEGGTGIGVQTHAD
jgi:hypothetical protein